MDILLYREIRDGNSTVQRVYRWTYYCTERLEMSILLYREFRDGHSIVQRV